MTAPILALRGVNKSFGPIDVLHDINLEVRPGEVLCLLGDNGAGKSTLIRILSGVHQPTTGRIEMDGAEVSFPTPRAAQEAGISTVHQFGGTFPLMSIGRSFFVGVEPTKGWGPFKRYDRRKANTIAVKAVQDMGITRITDGDRLVGGLSAVHAGLERLCPFGSENPEPRFAISAARILSACPVGQGHLRLSLTDPEGSRLEAIAFRCQGTSLGAALAANAGATFHLAGRLQAKVWQGTRRLQLLVEDAASARG